ncbi:hypothetical protein JCM17380_47410 [Desulfosporosinus burensis]
MTLFIRLLEVEDKAAALLRSIKEPDQALNFKVQPHRFNEVPGSPFAYWVSDRVRATFKRLEPFEAGGRAIRQGLATADDFRFVRTWWEISETDIGSKWFDFAKGGVFSPFYADIHLVVNWADNGAEICNFKDPITGKICSRPQNTDFYFRPGLTWSDRTTKRFSARIWPSGGVFSVKGSAGFFAGEEFFALALMNSAPFNGLISLLVGAGDAAARSYQVGVIGVVPYAPYSKQVAELAYRAWSLKRLLDTVNETSHAFVLPTVLRKRVDTFDSVVIKQELSDIQDKIDEIVFHLYGLEGEDRSVIESLLNHEPGEICNDPKDDDLDEVQSNAVQNDRSGLLSWCVGVAFGRFDLRLATGERSIPFEPEPFDHLPVRSPGMVPSGTEPLLPVKVILVDDLGHGSDIGTILMDILERCAISEGDLSADDCRTWLAKEFFSLHIKTYSKSRRKSPIYWQLATPSASYSVWIYAHAFTKDTFYKVQNDYVAPKLAHEEGKLEGMRQEFGSTPGASERKQLMAQETFVGELRAFLQEVKDLAPLWNPNINDGVIINFAPLWRLVPHCKTLQKELKTTWDALCAGKYDWSHLAMNLWPERVIPKCSISISLALNHGLVDFFCVQGNNGKLVQRKIPTRPIVEMVRERTSPATKAALERLLGTSVASINGRSRGTVVSSKGGNK